MDTPAPWLPSWGAADLFETFARAKAEQWCVVQGHRFVTWRELDRHADGVAATLVGAGLDRQDRLALYLHNCPEFLVAFIAATKASLVPVNTNYRYADDELVHLWDDSDAAAVVFHGTFTEVVERVRRRVPRVRCWLWVDDATGPCPDWAVPFSDAASAEPPAEPCSRSSDDAVFIYTGGTTGLPKGVIWRQGAMLRPIVLAAQRQPVDLAGYVDAELQRGPHAPVLPAPPLMHGTGLMAALQGLLTGAPVVLLSGKRFDAVELWDAVERHSVRIISIVGDAFARPMLDALDAEPARWDLSKLGTVMSAGAIFSEQVKGRLLAHVPHLKLVDQLGSTENSGAARSVSRSGHLERTAAFSLASGVRVIDASGNDVVPGSGAIGVIAIPGGADGYHKDPEKSAVTFPLLDGVRYTVAGDHATVESDGTLRLIGRGSVCINTGGEKVFPEEVEEALKSHHAVRDAIVVGAPDERFGETIVAVIELEGTSGGDDGPDDDELIAHVKSRLAGYKAPRALVRVASVGRAPNGKADYPATRAAAVEALAARAAPITASSPDPFATTPSSTAGGRP